MQVIAPVTSANLLAKGQQPLLKFEIYATNKVQNGEFSDDVSGWSQNNATLSRVASASDPGTASGGFDDWVMKMVDTGAASTVYQAFTTKVGESYRIIAKYYRVGGSGNLRARRDTWDGVVIQTEAFATAGAWTVITLNFVAATTTTVLTFENTSAVLYFDSVNFFILPEWINLCDLGGKNYLELISVSHGGAGMSPNPIAASLSAEISNEGGIFHPKHPTSDYVDYFTAGKKVRISIGATYGGNDYYWQRIIGYIDMPEFSLGKTFTVSINGLDYTKLLADTVFKKTAVPPDNYWGALTTFDSVVTSQYGAELYDPPGGDAAEIGVGEADNVANWAVLSNGATAISSEDDLGGFSDYEIKFIANPTGPAPDLSEVWYENVCDVVAGTEYYVTFKYARIAGNANLRFLLRDAAILVGGTGPLDPATNGVFYNGSFSFTPTVNATLDLVLFCLIGKFDDPSAVWRVDNISIKSVGDQIVHKYQMPDACMGIHYVELDEGAGFVPVWPGRQKDGEEGWFYDSALQQLYFAKGKIVDAGTANLKVYYYIQQIPENVVADILVTIGLYADQATALASMEYTATGVTIDQVWFKAGSKYLNAMKKICERCDYRFYFTWNGIPVFKPFPTAKAAGDEDMDFLKGHISDPMYYEDWNEIRNRVVIEGLKQALPEGADEMMPSELKGEVSDATSINARSEHTLSIKNHLFQDQASIDAMCTTLLARYKDPKWYLDFNTEYNPAPLEIWDTIKAELMLVGPIWYGKKYGTFKYDSGVLYGGSGTLVYVRGLIRDIKIDNHNITYKCEEIT